MRTNGHTDILDKFKDDHLFFSIISLKWKYGFMRICRYSYWNTKTLIKVEIYSQQFTKKLSREKDNFYVFRKVRVDMMSKIC